MVNDCMMNNRKLVVVGAGGMLGADVAKFFNAVSPSHSQLDICDPRSIETWFRENGIDRNCVIVNCAAVTDVAGT